MMTFLYVFLCIAAFLKYALGWEFRLWMRIMKLVWVKPTEHSESSGVIYLTQQSKSYFSFDLLNKSTIPLGLYLLEKKYDTEWTKLPYFTQTHAILFFLAQYLQSFKYTV